MNSITDVTEDSFSELVLNSDGPVLVDFWRQACAPCRMLAPVLQRFADQNGGIRVVKVNVEESTALAVRYGISSLPALSLFIHGELVKSLTGAKTLTVLNAEFGDQGTSRAWEA